MKVRRNLGRRKRLNGEVGAGGCPRFLWGEVWEYCNVTWEIMSNATAQWWFSNGEMSLYLMASSVLAFTWSKKAHKQNKHCRLS